MLLLDLDRLLLLLDRWLGALRRFQWGVSLLEGGRLGEEQPKLLPFCSILDLVG